MKHETYRTIVVDPPWPGPGESWSPGHPHVVIPYSTMTGIELSSLRIGEIADPKAQLFLWATSRTLGDAWLLMQCWRFQYRALFVWCKPGLGLGRHARHQCEFLLWGGRKGARLVEPVKCPRQVQYWPRPRRHSEKPPEAYAMIRRLSDAPRIDVFARQERPGFEPWGNQVPTCAAS